MITEELYFILWSEKIIVIRYNLVSFLHNFMENISILLIDNEIDFKITLRILNPEILQVYYKNLPNFVIFTTVFSIHIIQNINRYPNKEKRINFLFITLIYIYLPVSIHRTY